GQLRHALPGIWRVGVTDLDGDEVPDLYYENAKTRKLHAVRGEPAEPAAWRLPKSFSVGTRNRSFSVIHHDLDGDGVADLIGNQDGKLTALSGRNGSVLWQSSLSPDRLMAHDPCDLDGDRVRDLVHCDDMDVRGIPGKTG